MHSLAELFRSSWSLRAIALALITIGAAGCSAESTRFGDSGRGGQGEVTGSVAPAQGAPVGHVETRPLPPTSQPPPPQAYNPPAAPAPYNPPPSPTAYSPTSNSPASYNPARYNPVPSSEVTGSIAAPASTVRGKAASSGQWSWDGGIPVTVAQGETVESIAHRHGVPVGAVLAANHIASPNAIQAGQRLVIPRYIPSLAAPAALPTTHAAEPAAPASASSHAAGAVNSGAHVVAPGDTLTKIARQYGKSVADIAKANNIPPSGKITVGNRIVIPGARVGSAKPEAEQATAPTRPNGTRGPAGTTPAQSASMVTPVEPPTDLAPKAAADTTPGFRWPVRGRIIAAFGPKPNGAQNDGIDVAVPENTPVKAAEDGEVAYAGNELKGYGNLVLVKHANGYVTAYAYAKELLVKRGDKVKRGDVIAKSGQSGNVDAPQLHFEVRKGSTPIDPMQFLNGA